MEHSILLDFSKGITIQRSLRICILGFLGAVFENRENGSTGVAFSFTALTMIGNYRLLALSLEISF